VLFLTSYLRHGRLNKKQTIKSVFRARYRPWVTAPTMLIIFGQRSMLMTEIRCIISISLIDITLLMKLFKWVYQSTIANSITQI